MVGFAELDAFVERVRIDVFEEIFGLFRWKVEASEGAVAAAGGGGGGLGLGTLGVRIIGLLGAFTLDRLPAREIKFEWLVVGQWWMRRGR